MSDNSANGKGFEEALLFTHRGLSGPAILQVSSSWREGDAIVVDLFPGGNLRDILTEARAKTPKLQLQTILSHHLSKRLAQMLEAPMALPGISLSVTFSHGFSVLQQDATLETVIRIAEDTLNRVKSSQGIKP